MPGSRHPKCCQEVWPQQLHILHPQSTKSGPTADDTAVDADAAKAHVTSLTSAFLHRAGRHESLRLAATYDSDYRSLRWLAITTCYTQPVASGAQYIALSAWYARKWHAPVCDADTVAGYDCSGPSAEYESDQQADHYEIHATGARAQQIQNACKADSNMKSARERKLGNAQAPVSNHSMPNAPKLRQISSSGKQPSLPGPIWEWSPDRWDGRASHAETCTQQWHCTSQTIADSPPLPSKMYVSANSMSAGSHKKKMARAGGSHAEASGLTSAAGPGSAGCLSGTGMLGAAATAAPVAVRALHAAPPGLRLHQPRKEAHRSKSSLLSLCGPFDLGAGFQMPPYPFLFKI